MSWFQVTVATVINGEKQAALDPWAAYLVNKANVHAKLYRCFRIFDMGVQIVTLSLNLSSRWHWTY